MASATERPAWLPIRVTFVLCLLCLGLCACGDYAISTERSIGSPPAGELDPARRGLQQACWYLWSQQSEDGGWHSSRYALFRSGQALTPFILHALMEAPEELCTPPPTGIRKAIDFIRQHTDENGVIGASDPEILEYPNYATAYALRCLIRENDPRDATLIRKMTRYLIDQQYSSKNGFPKTTFAFGGWGFGGSREPGHPGHMDLAHTRHALQALAEAGVNNSDLRTRARSFLHLLQKHPQGSRPHPVPFGHSVPVNALVPYDGGFYFSPVVLGANKAGFYSDETMGYFRSYATATCDGILALLFSGVPLEDERVLSARRWLENHPRLDYPEGIPTDQAEDWGRAIFFYHLAARAETYRQLSWPGDWRKQLVRVLLPTQETNGSFRNRTNHLMKEDDPLLATALAISSLTQVFPEPPND